MSIVGWHVNGEVCTDRGCSREHVTDTSLIYKAAKRSVESEMAERSPAAEVERIQEEIVSAHFKEGGPVKGPLEVSLCELLRQDVLMLRRDLERLVEYLTQGVASL